MPWCPECKLEYVAGIKVCPDCKKALVESLDDIVEETLEVEEEQYEDMYSEPEVEEAEDDTMIRIDVMELVRKVQLGQMSPEEFNSIIAELRKQSGHTKEYRYRKDLYEENKSSVLVLLVVGIVGILVLILNACGVFNLPFKGFSLILTNIVMGGLFAIFVLSGIRAYFKAKKLLPEVEAESKLIEDCVKFLKDQKASGAYVLNEEVSFEEESLILSNICVESLEQNFDNLEEGFAFFVTDRYYSDIFEETYPER